MAIFGWDASDFDWGRGPMDLGAAVRDGITFFTHKATEGTRTRHVHYGEALNRARAAGMPLMGAYVVPRTPGNGGHGSVAQQVDYLLSYLDAQTPWWRTLPEFFLQVDTEHWGYDNVAPAVGAQMCDLLRARTGKWVVHYAPGWAYGNGIPGDHPLWQSAYGGNPAVPYRQAYRGDADPGWRPYSSRTPTFLQYGSKLTIGSQPGCDANAFRGTLDQLRTLITGGQDIMAALSDVEQRELLNGVRRIAGNWPQTITADGKPDGRPAGVHLADLWRYLVDGKGAYDTGHADPAGPPTGWYLDELLKQIRDARQASGAPTQAQVDAAILKAMLDPTVINALGAAVASHIHVS